MTGQNKIALLAALTVTLFVITGANPVVTEVEKEPAANDKKNSDLASELFINEVAESVLACDRVCPSKSMKCSEWTSCRSHHSDVCLGAVAICHDEHHDRGHKSGGPLKAVMIFNDLASDQNAAEAKNKIIIAVVFALLMLILLGVCGMICRVFRRLAVVRDGYYYDGDGKPEGIIVVGVQEKSQVPPAPTPAQLAAIEEIVKRINGKNEKRGQVKV